MNKKLIAVAVAGAFAAPAAVYAQASTVQLYGKVSVEYLYVDNGQIGIAPGDARKTDMLNSYSSYIGFKGEEKLGGGMAAWFQCETTLDVISGGGVLCARNSAVGFKGSIGNLFIGNWNTPYKQVDEYNELPTGGSVYAIRDLMHNGNQSNVVNVGASFNRRQQNLIQYASPNLGGFKVMAGFSAANEATAQTTGATLGKPRLWSLGVTYVNGPIYVGGGYEKHYAYNPAVQAVNFTALGYSGRLSDNAWQINGAYTFAGVFKLGAVYTRKDYSVSNSTDMDYNAWGVYGDWKIAGPHRLQAGYTRANDTKGSAGTVAVPIAVGSARANGGAGNTGAKQWSVRYVYALSKRTALNAGYTHLDNDTQARYRLQSGSPVPLGGSTQKAFALGAAHRF